ncbi:MAG TPA: hypothetical protein EYO58_07390, partial [Flavobacteriales bacterium]|nr:hypothetical protein [Flavobacteriales bacterium]
MGDNLPFVELGSGRHALDISGGNLFNCVVLDDFSVKCWGYGANGRTGYGSTNDLGDAGGEMGDNLPTVKLGSGRTAQSVHCGIWHCCSLLDDDSLKCWGFNDNGQLGQGSTDSLGNNPGEMGDNLSSIDLGSGVEVQDCFNSFPTLSPSHSHSPTLPVTSFPTLKPTTLSPTTISPTIVDSQPISLQESLQFGGTSLDYFRGLAVDSQDNIIIGGETLSNLFPDDEGSSDFVVIKYSSSLDQMWGWQNGSSTNDYTYGVAVDSQDDVYVSGYTTGVWFGDIGNNDIIVVKLQGSDGSLIWGERFGTTSLDYSSSLSIDSNDDLMIGGRTFSSWFSTIQGSFDVFAFKVDSSNGSLMFGYQDGSSNNERVNDLIPNSNNDVIITGYTEGSLYSTSQGMDDIFLAKLNGSDFSVLNSVQNGTNSVDQVNSVSVDLNDDIFITGLTYGDFFDDNSGGSDIFVMKVDGSDLSFLFGFQFGSVENDEGLSITTDLLGEIWVGGKTEGNLFSSNEGAEDGFISKHSGSDGSFLFKDQSTFSSSDDQEISYLRVHSDGNVAVGGGSNSAVFGTNYGFEDFIIAVYGCGEGREDFHGQCIFHPSFSPSFYPSFSVNPTFFPTFDPSYQPSYSFFPTYSPSISRSPSLFPTNIPSFHPSYTPTFAPSMYPTISPSLYPSSNPSFNPTFNPSLSPSLHLRYFNNITHSLGVWLTVAYEPDDLGFDLSNSSQFG